jgi:hypothetical protein
LQVTLPKHYRQSLLVFPPTLYCPEAETAALDWGPPDVQFFHTARTLIEYNRSVWEIGPCVAGPDGRQYIEGDGERFEGMWPPPADEPVTISIPPRQTTPAPKTPKKRTRKGE